MTAQDTLLKQVNTRRDTRLAEKQASCVPSHTQKPPRPTRGTGVGFMTTGNVRCSILGVLRDRGRSPGSLLGLNYLQLTHELYRHQPPILQWLHAGGPGCRGRRRGRMEVHPFYR